jgi:hypothetical protein
MPNSTRWADAADALEGPGQSEPEHFALAAELQRPGRRGGGAAVDVGVRPEQVECHAGLGQRNAIPGADDGHGVDLVGGQLNLQ